MALARLITFVPLTLIKSADVNGELNNILNNPVALISPSTGAINFNLQAHTNLVPSAITTTSATSGQVLQATTSGAAIFSNASRSAPMSRAAGLVGTGSSQIGSFAANQLIMQTTGITQSWTVSATSSFSANIGTAGPAAGGRDIAGSFASTYVHWYAISTGYGSTAPAALVSTNPPNVGPVAMPTSYSGWTYLGASVYSSVSTTVVTAHRFLGDWATYDAQTLILTGGTSTVETVIPLGTAYPSNASNVQYVAEFSVASGAGGASLAALELRVLTGVNFMTIKQQAPASNTIFNTASVLAPNVSQNLFYIIDGQISSANNTGETANIWIQSYQNPGVV